MKIDKGTIDIAKLLFFIFLFVGIFVRIWQFGNVPGDINQDEAYAGYEAYSILNYGIDSSGYRFPVYFVSWGSGMNALSSYLMIPFIAFCGLHTWVIRLPQFFIACLSLWVAYRLIQKMINTKAALCVLFLMSISPWHIMLSRWGLESNLAPGLLLFGLYFFVKGIENKKYFLVSALMYGMSLYSYATIWTIVPIILVFQCVYCILLKKIRMCKEIVLSGVIVFLLALPLVLFLFVNYGLIDEIRLPFISIPKLLYMRTGEISFRNISSNLKNLWSIIVTQSDGLIWNATERYGLFYKWSLPFFFLGLFNLIDNTVKSIKKHEFDWRVLILIQLMAGIILGSLITVNINRVNILFIPMIIVIAVGVLYLCELIGYKYMLIIPFIVYAICFSGFVKFYFGEYQQICSGYFTEGIEDAIKSVNKSDKTIYIAPEIHYPKVLFLAKEPTDIYRDTVKYKNYPSAFLQAASFDHYVFSDDYSQIDEHCIYIFNAGIDKSPFNERGFTIMQYDGYIVAEKY